MQFIDSLHSFLALKDDDWKQSQVETDLDHEVGLGFVNTGAVLGSLISFYTIA